MNTLLFPDYKNTILNVTASILRHYHVKSDVPTLPLLDKELSKNYRNVVLVLIDAMGVLTMENALDKKSSLRKDQKAVISSVFPSTTVSATTAVISGKTPMETAWLGWVQYFKEEQKSVILFTNEDYYDETVKLSHPVAWDALPYETIYDQIEKASPDVTTTEIFPAFRTPAHDSFLKQCQSVIKTTKDLGRHFIYCYWDKLDTISHEFGPKSLEAQAMMHSIETAYQFLKQGLDDDTLVVVFADHGQVDVEPICLVDYPDLQETFLHNPSLEGRATAFFIQPDKKKIFEQRFKDHFRTTHVLYPAEEAVKMGLFGKGIPHPRFQEFLGDYLGVAIDKYYFQFAKFPISMKGQHAGLLADEMLVPLIIHSPKQ